MSDQKFHCPTCHVDDVRPQPIKCHNCGRESETIPVVVTGEMQNMLSSAEEYVNNAISILTNIHMNIMDEKQKKELEEVFTLLSLANGNHNALEKIFNS